MKIPKLFNKRIRPSCEYCTYCNTDDPSVHICTLNKTMTDDGCKKFTYDPLMRMPKRSDDIETLNPSDFVI